MVERAGWALSLVKLTFWWEDVQYYKNRNYLIDGMSILKKIKQRNRL